MFKAIDFASNIGVRIIQLAGYDIYYDKSCDKSKANFIKNLKISVEYASIKGIILAFETMETDFMDTVEKSMKYVSLIDSPYLGVYPDIGNLTNASKIYQINVLDDIKLGKGHIFAAHLKETIVNHYREIEFGEGHTDFVECIKTLKELGVNMYTAEFWYVGQDNWQQTCIDANKFLKDKIKLAYK